jgi:hypothetical protein
MSLFGTYRNRNCPRVALVNAWPTVVPRMPRAMLIAASSRSRQAPAVFNGLENLSERVGFYYRRYLQVLTNPTLPR